MEPEVMRQIVSSLLLMALISQCCWLPLATASHHHHHEQQTQGGNHHHHHPVTSGGTLGGTATNNQHPHRQPSHNGDAAPAQDHNDHVAGLRPHPPHPQRKRTRSVSQNKDGNGWVPQPPYSSPHPPEHTPEVVHFRPSSDPHRSLHQGHDHNGRADLSAWTRPSWEHALGGEETWTTASRDPAPLGRKPELWTTIPPEPMREEDEASNSDVAPPPPSPDYEALIQPFPPRKTSSRNQREKTADNEPSHPCDTVHTKAEVRHPHRHHDANAPVKQLPKPASGVTMPSMKEADLQAHCWKLRQRFGPVAAAYKPIILAGTDCRKYAYCRPDAGEYNIKQCKEGQRMAYSPTHGPKCFPDELVDCFD